MHSLFDSTLHSVTFPLSSILSDQIETSKDYSSLSHLKHFPIFILKIGRSFTHDILTDSDSLEIIVVIIASARSLNFSVLAEALETKKQFNFLYNLQCNIDR